MKTRKMLVLFFGVKGLILLAPLSFVVLHYMLNSVGLSKKEDINILDPNGYTPLMYAAQHIYLDGVKKLIDDGADLNILSKNLTPRYFNPDRTQKVEGSAAIHMACAAIDNSLAIEIVRYLVFKGANTRIKALASGQTPLHSAFYSSYTLDDRALRVAEFLIKNGADINAQDCDGDTIVHYAVNAQRRDWLKAILGQRFGPLVDNTVKNKRGLTALGRAQELRLELEDDFHTSEPPIYEPSDRDPNGFTGLMLATIRGDRNYINKVPDGDPSFNARSIEKEGDEYGYTALHLALLHEKLNLIEVLLKKGAHAEIRDKRGLPFFHRLFFLQNLDDRKKIIDIVARYSSLNIQDANGNTLLHHAVINSDTKIISYLLSRYKEKVATTIRNNNYDTPGDLARKADSRELLVAFGALTE